MTEWQRKNQLADEISRALTRVPVAKHTQLAKLIGVRREFVYRLVRYMELRYRVRPYKQQQRSTRFHVMQGTQSYVQLTTEERNRFSRKDNVTPVEVVRSEDFGRYIATMDILVGLRKAGITYDELDLTIPHQHSVPYHAWLTPGGDDSSRIGVFLLPHKYPGTRQISILRGIISKVDQKVGSKRTLYLVPAEHYAATVNVMLKLDLQNSTTYLLPVESFLLAPRECLWAISKGEDFYTHALTSMLAPVEERQRPPQYDYASLVQLPDGSYRFLDTYVSGDIRRVNHWLQKQGGGYIVPGTGKVATGRVYVRDEYMRFGLMEVQDMRAKTAEVEFLSWPFDVTS